MLVDTDTDDVLVGNHPKFGFWGNAKSRCLKFGKQAFGTLFLLLPNKIGWAQLQTSTLKPSL